jgi:hypothetical protein
MKKLIIVYAACFLPAILSAQNDIDAYRYSIINTSGTAKSMSMGGALGALGGDFSVLSSNPAGTALYRKSEFSITPSLLRQKTTSMYLGNNEADDKFNFNFGNLGVVYHFANSGNWKNWDFSMGYNRLSSFHTRSLFSGINSKNSLLDYYAERANGKKPNSLDNFNEGMAYQAYLIDPVNMDSTLYKGVIRSGGELQERSLTSRGSNGEFVMGFAGNFKDRVYIGMSLGIPFISYREEVGYFESDKSDTIPSFKSFNWNQNLFTDGIGYNLKLGLIFRATDWLRLGGAFHTPTFFDLSDKYSSDVVSNFDNGSSYTYKSPEGAFDYEITTPMRTMGNISIIILKKASLNAEIEFVDYSESRIRSSTEKFLYANSIIRKNYKAVNNLKFGAEVYVQPDVSLRAGYALFNSPYVSAGSGPDAKGSCSNYSIGLGLREQDAFIDFSYVLSVLKNTYIPYTLNTQGVSEVSMKSITNNFSISLGLKF